MPFDRSIKKVLVIGAGPIVIGQACEFDYSGAQACKALREEGCQVILLNSNPSTIMTDNHIADIVYIEPMTVEVVEKIICRERPDSLLATMGGQTALNCALECAELGILKKYGITLLGLTFESIEKASNRELFKAEMLRIGMEVLTSFSVANWHEVILAQQNISFPLIVRCSFTLGGQGGGVAHDFEELTKICKDAFTFSKKLLIEESVIGWKEFELEVIKDRKGNYIVVCGIENIDPMGVHTGDSMTVSPIQTLTDKEYQRMRKWAFQIVEAVEISSGGCNVQFAVNPKTGRMICIEVNPRVSRSSAFASKATGYPIAKIATKLALGYNLDELHSDTPLFSFPYSLEPVIDYVVIKIPRFDFDKFPKASQKLTTHMKSIGEVMGFGRTFKESLNKAISSLDLEFRQKNDLSNSNSIDFQTQLKTAHPQRLWIIHAALHHGIALDEVHQQTHYDRWFLAQICELVKEEQSIAEHSIETVDFKRLYRWKQMGFSDKKLARLLKCFEQQIVELRKILKIHPVYKRVDTCSGEFPNEIVYMYSTYEEECESDPSEKKKVLVLGSGPNRIGQGIEFDYCCVQAVQAIRALGYESIILNCNPGTISTDYDTTDRLYFEPLTIEHVCEVIRKERPIGTIIQFGGQTPLQIGKYLYEESIALLGTPFASIDITEDRQKFRKFADDNRIKQPKNVFFSSLEEALCEAHNIGYPMIVRPSYTIGGGKMQIIKDEFELNAYINDLTLEVIAPILMEEFLEDALEIDVDAIYDGRSLFICGIIEHVEPAGVHSGDSLSYLFPCTLSMEFQNKLIEQTRKIGHALNVIGLFNVQFAIYKNEIVVLEVNARASRTIPLLSKTTGLNLVQIATNCMFGISLKEQDLAGVAEPKFLGLKLPVFPFSRLHLENEQLGPQMKSTGEVLCIGKTFDDLMMKARMYASKDKNLFTSDLDVKLPFPDTLTPLKIYDINQM